ncbi:AAA family ATPase [Campylobacter lari]|uniref:AAA family ATPase n=1 Tax=Campylobacter lari TaxID=201 RepID=UPI0027D4601E|nr:AAA family ATPase [Campylobacter lari]
MNINLNEEQKKNIKNNFLEFQKIWTLEKVKDMTLEEYTSTKKDNPDRNDFTFWIENKLDDIGSIWGGSSFKFGIYKRNFNDDKENLKGKIYNDNYAWLSKYGNNQDEAFDKIKQTIVDIIQASKNNDFKTIENIDFGDATKWKIAFHYQDVNNIKIVNIFSKNVLDLISLNEFKEKLKIYQIYEKLLENKNLSLIKMIENIAIPLWNKYGINSQNFDNFEDNIENLPLNQIFYGPPGTGKTYRTIDKALEILGENLEDRDDKKAKFDEYVKNRQIVFTTFHQSYGYEEFVEGIKPRINSEENSKEIEYEIKDGIFKELCNEALYKEIKINNLEELGIDNKTNSVWKISLGEKVRKDTEFLQKYCFENNQIRIGWGDTKNANGFSICNFGKMQIGDLVCVLDTRKTIKAIGVVKSEVKYSKEEEFEKDYGFDLYEYQTYRDVEWILKDNIIDIYKLNHNTKLNLDTVYKLWRISVNDILEEIEKQYLNETSIIETIDNTKKKFVIIIDEINRGNVSKIFGELITLIEPSKRIGEEGEIKVKLPYSGKDFGVPKNVYIIGTMNTADRSITSLDTALRRRFEFVEMMPKPNVLSDNCEGVNLQKLLEAINTRIEYLLDREKTIGHAFFIGIDNLEKLKKVFQNKIIPLLQEYFYNDYALIDAVLNENGMLEKQDINNDYLKNMKDFIESGNVVYKFSDSEDWVENTFIKIYENDK